MAWLSHQPRPPLPRLLLDVSDKVLHAAEYAPVGFLWAILVEPRGALTALGAAAACGLGDEAHQAFVPGRDASALDLAADIVGAALGVGAHRLTRRRRAKKRRR